MASAVEVFRQGAIANKRLEQEAEANRIETEASGVRLTAEAEAAAQKRLQEATVGPASGLRRLAVGAPVRKMAAGVARAFANAASPALDS